MSTRRSHAAAPVAADPQATPLIAQFVDSAWAELGLSRNTVAAYRSDLSLFARWLHGGGETLEAVSRERI